MSKNRLHFWQFIAILGLIISVEARSATCVELVSSPRIETTEYSYTTLRQKIPAVHATDVFPEDGVIRANGGGTPGFRPETHFALGSLVQPIPGVSTWENKKFAIITPLKNLEPQALNYMAHDTFILGDFEIPRGSILVVPESEKRSPPEGIIVLRYNSSNVSLRNAVDTAIQQGDLWHFKGKPGDGWTYDPALLEDTQINMNSRDVLHPLLRVHPQATFTTHGKTRIGFIDFWLFFGLHKYGSVSKPYKASTLELKFKLAAVRLHLRKLDSEFSNPQLPKIARESYSRSRQELEGWLNIVEADLEVRKKYGRTAFLSPEKFKNSIFELRNDLDHLSAFLDSHRNDLDPVVEYSLQWGTSLGEDLVSFTSHEVRLLDQKFPEVFKEIEGGVDHVLLWHALARQEVLGTEKTLAEGLHTTLAESLAYMMQKRKNQPYVLDSIFERISDPKLRRIVLSNSLLKQVLEPDYDLAILSQPEYHNGYAEKAFRRRIMQIELNNFKIRRNFYENKYALRNITGRA